MQVKSLSDGLLFATVRIETFGAEGPGTTSTGFVFEYRADDNRYPFLVTAKHGVAGAENGRITFMQEERGQPALSRGYTLDIENFGKLWYPHPDESVDIAVTPFVPFVKHIEDSGIPVYFRAVDDSKTVSAEQFANLSVLDEVVFVGYPSGICDEHNLLPVPCRGITATPVSADFNGREQFLVSGAIYPGSSGSPVYRCNPGNDDGELRLSLMGMLVAGYCQCQDLAKQNIVGYKERPIAEIFTAAPGESVDFGVALKVRVVTDIIAAYLKEKGFI